MPFHKRTLTQNRIPPKKGRLGAPIYDKHDLEVAYSLVKYRSKIGCGKCGFVQGIEHDYVAHLNCHQKPLPLTLHTLGPVPEWYIRALEKKGKGKFWYRLAIERARRVNLRYSEEGLYVGTER